MQMHRWKKMGMYKNDMSGKTRLYKTIPQIQRLEGHLSTSRDHWVLQRILLETMWSSIEILELDIF